MDSPLQCLQPLVGRGTGTACGLDTPPHRTPLCHHRHLSPGRTRPPHAVPGAAHCKGGLHRLAHTHLTLPGPPPRAHRAHERVVRLPPPRQRPACSPHAVARATRHPAAPPLPGCHAGPVLAQRERLPHTHRTTPPPQRTASAAEEQQPGRAERTGGPVPMVLQALPRDAPHAVSSRAEGTARRAVGSRDVLAGSPPASGGLPVVQRHPARCGRDPRPWEYPLRFFPPAPLAPNASAQPRLKAAAQRTL
jgi:hypothetical protein